MNKRGKIVAIGKVLVHPDLSLEPVDWVFDCQGDDGIPGFNFLSDGTVLYAGWSARELLSISRSGKIPLSEE